jgi:DNA-binding transcriptional regulator YiaG
MLPFSQLDISIPKPFGIGYEPTPQTLGNHIRNKRLEMRISQPALAKLIGVKQMTISYWERDKFKPQTG